MTSLAWTVPDHIIAKLNPMGLYHGRAALLAIPEVRQRIEEKEFVKWENPDLAPLFTGLYITNNKHEAESYAHLAVDYFHDWYGTPVEWAVPVVHQIKLLPGIAVVLDEDELRWQVVANAYHHHGMYTSRDAKLPFNELKPTSKILELASAGNFKRELLNSIKEVATTQLVDIEERGSDDWTPGDMKEEVIDLCVEWTGPVLEAWSELPYEWHKAALRNPYHTLVPNLVLRNQNWLADPPFADRAQFSLE